MGFEFSLHPSLAKRSSPNPVEPHNGRMSSDHISLARITVSFGSQTSHSQAFRTHLTHTNVLTCTRNVPGRQSDGRSFVKNLKFKTVLQERGKGKKIKDMGNDVEKRQKKPKARSVFQELWVRWWAWREQACQGDEKGWVWKRWMGARISHLDLQSLLGWQSLQFDGYLSQIREGLRACRI